MSIPRIRESLLTTVMGVDSCIRGCVKTIILCHSERSEESSYVIYQRLMDSSLRYAPFRMTFLHNLIRRNDNKKYFLRIFSFLLSLIILSIISFSCANENPNLVNPPPQSKTVRIRFINFASDGLARSLALDATTQTGMINYGFCSDTLRPPADSCVPTIYISGSGTDTLPYYKIKFLRETYYSFFGLPSQVGDTLYRPLDTIVVLGTTSSLPKISNTANVKLLNAYPDQRLSFSLSLGCPNGVALASSLPYRSATRQFELRSGIVTVSLMQIDNTNKVKKIGTYNLRLQGGGQYILVISKGTNGDVRLINFDEFYQEPGELIPLDSVPDLESQIRTINFSTEPIEVKKLPDNVSSGTVPPEWISSYISVPACGPPSLVDTIAAFVSGEMKSLVETSLGVSERYTAMVFDSANSKAYLTVLAEPLYLSSPSDNNAVVRVVQGNYRHRSITVSIGSRTMNNNVGYQSGDKIAADLQYGKVSDPALVHPGDNIPVTLFAATQPDQLLFSTLISLEKYDKMAGNSYLLVVTTTKTGGDSLALIKETTENADVNYSEKGVFTQIINMYPSAQTISLTLPPLLTVPATLYKNLFVATVLPVGTNYLNINGISPFPIDTRNRGNQSILIVIGSRNQNMEIYEVEPYSPSKPIANLCQIRFVNTSSRIDSVNVRFNEEVKPAAERIGYRQVKPKPPHSEIRDRKLSMSFYHVVGTDTTILYRSNDVYFTIGKNYTIIFGDSTETKGHTAIIQQEY